MTAVGATRQHDGSSRAITSASRRSILASLWGTALVVVAAGAWIGVVGAVAVWRHNQFLSHRYDLGNMVQAVWSSAEGRLLEITDGSTGEQIVRLGAHVDPILLAFVPFWWASPTPATLIVLQAAVLAAGLYPVVKLAQKYVHVKTAVVLLGVLYLVFPWTLWNALNGFHPVTLSAPLLLYAIWYLDERRLGRFAVFAGLVLLTQELLGLTIAMVGIWFALRHMRRTGLVIAASGVAWTAICLAVLIPAFNDGNSSRFYDRFESVGGTPRGLVITLVTDPGTIVSEVTTSADLRYVALVLLATGFLALGSPLLAMAATPQLGVNLLSSFWSTTQPMFQYVMPMTAPLIVATILAIGRFPLRLRSAAAAIAVFGAYIGLLVHPPVPGGQDYVFGKREPAARIEAMRAAVSLVPADAPVTSTNRLGAHLSERKVIQLFPVRKNVDWAILDTRDAWLALAGERVDRDLFAHELREFEREAGWTLVFDSQDVRVYRRQS